MGESAGLLSLPVLVPGKRPMARRETTGMRCLPTGVAVPLLHLAFAPRGRLLAAGGEDGRVRLWHLPAGGPAAFAPRQSGSVRAVAFVGEEFLATSGGDWLRRAGELRLWDVRTGVEVRLLWKHSSPVTALAVSPDGARLAAGAGDGTVRVWDTATWDEVAGGPAHDDEVLALAWSPDGDRLASAGADHVVRLLDGELDPRHVLFGHERAVRGAAFAPDGAEVVSLDEGGLRWWDAATGTALRHRPASRGGLRAVAVTPTGSVLTAGALRDGQAELRRWDDAGSEVLHRHRAGLTSLAVAPDGRSLAATDLAGDVLLGPVG